MNSIYRWSIGSLDTGLGLCTVFDAIIDGDLIDCLKVYVDKPCTFIINDSWRVEADKSVSFEFRGKEEVQHITILESDIRYHTEYIFKKGE